MPSQQLRSSNPNSSPASFLAIGLHRIARISRNPNHSRTYATPRGGGGGMLVVRNTGNLGQARISSSVIPAKIEGPWQPTIPPRNRWESSISNLRVVAKTGGHPGKIARFRKRPLQRRFGPRATGHGPRPLCRYKPSQPAQIFIHLAFTCLSPALDHGCFRSCNNGPVIGAHPKQPCLPLHDALRYTPTDAICGARAKHETRLNYRGRPRHRRTRSL